MNSSRRRAAARIEREHGPGRASRRPLDACTRACLRRDGAVTVFMGVRTLQAHLHAHKHARTHRTRWSHTRTPAPLARMHMYGSPCPSTPRATTHHGVSRSNVASIKHLQLESLHEVRDALGAVLVRVQHAQDAGCQLRGGCVGEGTVWGGVGSARHSPSRLPCLHGATTTGHSSKHQHQQHTACRRTLLSSGSTPSLATSALSRSLGAFSCGTAA